MVYPKKQESATGRSATGETRFSKAKIEAEPQGNARPRIVSMTANAMEGDRELCLEAGMEFVSKPIRVERLVETLTRVATSHPVRRQE